MTAVVYQFGSKLHRLYQYSDGRVSLLDYSGQAPEVTDDGPLIVEPGTTCTLGLYHSGIMVAVPVERLKFGDRAVAHIGLLVATKLFELVPQLKLDESETFHKAAKQWVCAATLLANYGSEL